MESIYEHPLYYDILFGWDRSAEARFYHEAFLHHGAPPGGRVLELACGTGQIALRLARQGWRVTGLDRSSAMLEFLARRAEEEGLSISRLCADMTCRGVGNGARRHRGSRLQARAELPDRGRAMAVLRREE